ncbi:MAG: fimbrillin family protein [Rikenellaceae bacterium]|nr:fimbrillin family protein [Rikenellaceae bacterium]
MKLHLTRMALAIALAAFHWSCTRTDVKETSAGGSDNDLVQAVIHAGIGSGADTRAHDAEWDENDAIGLTMLTEDGSQFYNDVYNYHYITAQSLGVFEPKSADMVVHLPADGSYVTFRAYYPYYSGLDQNMVIPVDVSNQNVLPDIDLMSTDGLDRTRYSKATPNVYLYFYHRLSKVIFKLSADEDNDLPSFEDATVAIRGMKTTGNFHLMDEELDVDNDSEKVLTFPLRDDSSERYGIVLPRAAAAGVEFDFTFGDGSKYTAKMDDDLELEAGYQYTFYIRIKETEATVSAEIAPWEDAPERYYTSVQASVDAGESVNVDEGTVMDVFISSDNIDYNPLASFVYGEDKWESDPEIYWESISYNPAYMRSSIVMADPLNSTQTGDWLVSDVETVARNTGANFTLQRAVSKVFVTLVSKDQFTLDELNSATIVLPDYLMGGYLEDGVFVPGTTREDIQLAAEPATDTRATVTTARRVALLQPQSVSSGGAVVKITINGRTYEVEAPAGGFDFEAGVAESLIVTMNKEGITVSATVVNWEEGELYEVSAVQPSTVAGSSYNVSTGDKLDLYLYDNATSWDYLSSYVYQADGSWDTGTPVHYWEDMPDPAYFIARMDAAPALDDTQLPDVLLSDATAGYSNTGIDFVLTHAAAKALVVISSTTFDNTELADAEIILPGYKTGGEFVGAALQEGTTTGDITTVHTDDISAVAIFQPQTVTAGSVAARILLDGLTYDAKAEEDIVFDPGVATTLIVKMNKGEITVSVDVRDWATTTVELEAHRIIVEAGSTDGVDQGEEMTVYVGAERELMNTYTYDQDEWTTPSNTYWEDFGDVTSQTFYAAILRQAAYNSTMPDDYLLSGATTVTRPNAVNFELTHAVARVAVVLDSSDGTVSDADLQGMEIVLPGYATGGTYDRGVFTSGSTAGDIEVQKGVGENNESALAFLQPQTITPGTTVARVTNSARKLSYTVSSSTPIHYQAGYTTILYINIRETAVLISATVVDWEEGDTIEMVPAGIPISGELGNTHQFFDGKTIYIYNMTSNTETLPYTFLNGSWSGEKLYWEKYYQSGLDLAAVYYPYNDYIPTDLTGLSSFTWNVEADQSTGWDRRDLLMAYESKSSQVHEYFNFTFEHVLARVQVNIVSTDFTDDQLKGATVRLTDFQLNGTANLRGANVTPASGTSTVTPLTVTDGHQYEAIVMPQKINNGNQVLTIRVPGYDYTFEGIIDRDLDVKAGYITYINVDLRRTEILLSATLEEWNEDGDTGNVIIN